MSDQAMRFRLGLFVLAALILLGVLITMFGGLPTLLTRYHQFVVTFANAPGLSPGTPVRRSGIRIGRVRTVDLDSATGKVNAHIQLESKYPIYRDDQPTLVNGLLGGDSTIDLVPASSRSGRAAAERVALKEGAHLDGVAQGDVGGLVSQASGLMSPAQDALTDLRKSLRALDKIGPLVEETLREYRDLARATRAMVPQWHGVGQAARRTVPEWEGVGKAAREALPEWRQVAKSVQQLLPEIQELAKQIRLVLPDFVKESHQTVTEFRRTGAEIQLAVQSWGKLGERLAVLEQTNEQKLEHALDYFNKTLAGVSGVFTEENQNNITVALRNLRAGSDQLASIGKNADGLLYEGRQTIRRMNDSMTKADEVLNSVQDTFKPLPERTRTIMKNLDESTDKLNKLLTEVRDLLAQDGSLRRFMTDPSLYNHLNDAACMVSRSLPRMELILRDVQVFTDKIARHPESIGLGGVIHPSAGLKEGPSASFGRTHD
jgi:ABC-type transporter Mla subunit MlaD